MVDFGNSIFMGINRQFIRIQVILVKKRTIESYIFIISGCGREQLV